MKVTLDYYINWLKWALGVARVHKERNDVLSLFALFADLGQVLDLLFKLGATFPEGKGFDLAGKMFKWGLNNPDPLKPVREKMEAIKTKWSVP